MNSSPDINLHAPFPGRAGPTGIKDPSMPSPLRRLTALAAATSLLAAPVTTVAQSATAPARDLVITNAIVMTVTHGTIDKGSVWIHDGKLAGVGKTVAAPADARIIDAGGRYVTPGIIEAHAHLGMGEMYDPQDTNEYEGAPWGRYAGPIQSDLRIRDSIKTDGYPFYLMLSAGMTPALALPGSANLFGGQTVPIKLKLGRPREEMFISAAPPSFKLACGDTPVSVWKGRGVSLDKPEDVAVARRRAYDAARAYLATHDAYDRAVAA